MNTRHRLMYGGVVGALCVLPFYQGLWTACVRAGLSLPLYPNGGPPLIVTLCLIGGAIGAAFALALPRCGRPGWQCGAALGLLVTLVLWFVVAPLKGVPLAGGWHLVRMLQTLTIHVAWGVSVGVALPLLTGWLDGQAPGSAPSQPV